MDKQGVLAAIGGGLSMAGPYLLGLFQNADPTASFETVIGGAGIATAVILFVVGAFGGHTVIKTTPTVK